jgi:2-oxoglutarate dehydrogenase E2 component (dihydrolipoamide succinyltransferase)
MSVSVSMPQLGESVTEGTVTRWLKKEGERVEADEPLLEVSTDKVDTEIPSPASGILRGIAVDEDETVAVGAQLAIIEEEADAAGGGAGPGSGSDSDAAAVASADAVSANGVGTEAPAAAAASEAPSWSPPPSFAQPGSSQPGSAQPGSAQSGNAQPGYVPPSQPYQPYQAPAAAPPYQAPASTQPYEPPAAPAYQLPAYQGPTYQPPAAQAAAPPAPPAPALSAPAPSTAPAPAPSAAAPAEEYPPPTPLPSAGDTPYVTPLVRKLASEHAVNLDQVTGTGVGGRIRKQDVIEAARAQRASSAASVPAYAPAEPASSAAEAAPTSTTRPAIVPSSLRGTTQKLSRPRQVIAQRMVESLHVSAQLTTVVEADVTAIARLRERAKREFEAREGTKLSFLPFFALAAVEALKVHPKLNAVLDGDQVTYHDAEHLGIAVDTERGLMVPVIHNAGDLNIGGLARKIGDLAARTRSGQVSPDELAGGTFTLTNTGSRGALFDTPIINQPQVAILGTGTVVKRAVVVEDPRLGEVIAVRSMVYLALTYDHRLVDGADAARFLVTVKNRLEEGSFEAELGL